MQLGGGLIASGNIRNLHAIPFEDYRKTSLLSSVDITAIEVNQMKPDESHSQFPLRYEQDYALNNQGVMFMHKRILLSPYYLLLTDARR